jgi:hypothetical protein
MTSTWALVVVSGIALAALNVYFSRHSRNKLFGTREDESLERLRTMSKRPRQRRLNKTEHFILTAIV